MKFACQSLRLLIISLLWASLFLPASCYKSRLKPFVDEGEEDCGDGFCVVPETVSSCPADCRSGGWECGNGVCEPGENHDVCPQDCLSIEEGCGDGACEGSETAASCPDDCESQTPVFACGNGICEAGETSGSCPNDCSSVSFFDGACEENGTLDKCVLNETGDSVFSGEGLVGFSAAIIGDMDGDGLDDIVIGAPRDEQVGEYAGALYLLYGRRSGFDDMAPLSRADAVLLGAHEYDSFGYAVAASGDVDGNGLADFLVGAPADDFEWGSGRGQVYLIRGDSARMSGTLEMSDHSYGSRTMPICFMDSRVIGAAGAAVAGGDLDGDGFHDILIAAPSRSLPGEDLRGAVYLVYGQPWQSVEFPVLLDDVAAGWTNDVTAIHSISVDGAGDIDGDGFADFLVEAHVGDTSIPSIVYLKYGRGERFVGLVAMDGADAEIMISGGELAGAMGVGDLDADGYDDVLIGRRARDNNPAAYLLYGRPDRLQGIHDVSEADAAFVAQTEAPSGSMRHVAGIGDINGDGHDDFAIRSGYEYLNAVFVFLGGDERFAGSVDTTGAKAVFIVHDDDNDENDDCIGSVGSVIAGGGDVNGDGFGDFLIGDSGRCGGVGFDSWIYLVLGTNI